jgi:hypothetical protein
MSKQNIMHTPHPYLWGPTDRYTPFYSLFRDKLSLPRELVYGEPLLIIGTRERSIMLLFTRGGDASS